MMQLRVIDNESILFFNKNRRIFTEFFLLFENLKLRCS